LLAVGRIARAHGLRGRVLLAPYNEASEGLERASAFWLQPRTLREPGGAGAAEGPPRRFEVAHAERVHLGYLVSLRGVIDRDAAEALRGSEALIEREELPALEADQIWAADLVGMQVRDEAGAVRGEVVGLEAAGPNDLLQVKAEAGVALVPMGLVREVDEEGRTIVIEAPEGLFEVS
jgi:16S rRNA processing protein RimM